MLGGFNPTAKPVPTFSDSKFAVIGGALRRKRNRMGRIHAAALDRKLSGHFTALIHGVAFF